MKRYFILIAFIFFNLSAFNSLADTLLSNGTGGGIWDESTTWDGASIPDDMAAGDTLVIQAGDTVIIDGNETFTGVLQIYGVLILDNGKLDMGSGSVVQLAADSDVIALNNGENEYISIGSPSNRISSSYINNNLIKPNQLTEDNISSGGCAVTMDCDDNPLPVEVIYFRAVEMNKAVRLEWATSFEEDFDFFTVERSLDGIHFSDYFRVYSRTDYSTQTREYSFVDEMPFAGRSYYRLRSTDFDGTMDYHGVVSANLKEVDPDILIYANPAVRNQITVSFSGDQTSSFRVVDITGKLIEEGSLLPGLNDIQIPPSMSRSIYFFQVEGQHSTIVEKFIIR